MSQALLEHDQTADPAIAVLEGVDLLKMIVKVDHVPLVHRSFSLICPQQLLHLGRHFLWSRSIHRFPDHIGQSLVVPDPKPRIALI